MAGRHYAVGLASPSPVATGESSPVVTGEPLLEPQNRGSTSGCRMLDCPSALKGAANCPVMGAFGRQGAGRSRSCGRSAQTYRFGALGTRRKHWIPIACWSCDAVNYGRSAGTRSLEPSSVRPAVAPPFEPSYAPCYGAG